MRTYVYMFAYIYAAIEPASVRCSVTERTLSAARRQGRRSGQMSACCELTSREEEEDAPCERRERVRGRRFFTIRNGLLIGLLLLLAACFLSVLRSGSNV